MLGSALNAQRRAAPTHVGAQEIHDGATGAFLQTGRAPQQFSGWRITATPSVRCRIRLPGQTRVQAPQAVHARALIEMLKMLPLSHKIAEDNLNLAVDHARVDVLPIGGIHIREICILRERMPTRFPARP